jgi:hypothetical protein
MSNVAEPLVPVNSDGLVIPRLIPVAACLCVEGYPDAARSRVLNRLADGNTPRQCVEDGALEAADLAEVERIMLEHGLLVPPGRVGGAPEALLSLDPPILGPTEAEVEEARRWLDHLDALDADRARLARMAEVADRYGLN